MAFYRQTKAIDFKAKTLIVVRDTFIAYLKLRLTAN